MQDFHIFESIRENKENGESMLVLHIGLEPVLVSGYSDTFELLVVEVKIANKAIQVITGYGPQENWQENGKTPFYNALDEEIASTELEGKSILIAMDANAKLGPEYIQGDPHKQSQNGKVMTGTIERHALCVANGMT